MQMRRRSPFRGTALRVVGFALVLAFALAAIGLADSGPVVGFNTQINDPQQLPPNDWPNRNTPSLAASEDGQRLVAVFEDFQGFCGPPNNRPCPAPVPPGLTGFSFSTDGGKTWTDGGTLPPIGVATSAGHPSIGRSGEGEDEVYYAVTRMRGTATSPVGLAGLGVYRGRFSAGTFVWESAQIINSTNPNDQYSRPSLAVAKDGSGAAYIVLTNVLELCGIPSFGFGQIEVWRTHDAGETWQGPAVASPDTAESSDPNDPLCGVLGPIQVAPAISIGTQGEVYVFWQLGPRFLDLLGTTEAGSIIGFNRSLDGGQTFETRRLLITINSNNKNTPVGHGKSRQNDQPRTAVATSGPHRGRVYLTFNQPVQPVLAPVTVQSNVSTESFITWSDNQGMTWSTPKPLTTPVPATGVKRIWPTVAVRPGGAVDVVYLEIRETQATPNPTDIECRMPTGAGLRTGPLSSLVDTWWVQSRDGGNTFGPPVRVSETTSNWCSTFYTFSNGVFSNYGDYLGIATSGNRTFVLWPDGRNGVTDVFFAEVKGKTGK